MNLRDLKPGPLFTNADEDLPKLLGHMLTWVQFVPNIRHALGWRGLAPCEQYPYTWTARIGGRPGIFGVYPDGVESDDSGWAQATFRIAYFPDPDEPVLRHFSTLANSYAEKPDYRARIRSFVDDLDMAAAFEVGQLQFAADSKGSGLVLGLSGLSRRRVTVNEHSTNDEYAPVYTLAYQLFKVLAASAAYVVGEAPSQLVRNTRTGWRYSRMTDGRWREHVDDSLNHYELRLTFGGKDANPPVFDAPANTALKQTATWRAPAPLPALYACALWWRSHDLETLSVVDKRSLGVEDRPQLFVLSGFLGSGKTSFLQNFIEYQLQHRRFVAVIQNEVGKVSVDGKLLDEAYAITELNDGTVCCSLAGDLRPAIREILNNFHPDVIVIETSGIANPLGLQADVRALEDIVRFDSVTTVVDAEQFERCAHEYDVAADQVRAADVVVLNKTDLASNEKLDRLEQALRVINPHAAIARARNGAVNPGLLYDFGLTAGVETHDDAAAASTHSHDGVSSIKVDFPTHVQTKDLIDVLENVPPTVFRIKGVVDVVGRGPTLVQFVGGRFNLSEFQNPNVAERFLVLIGHELDIVSDRFRSIINAPDARECAEESLIDQPRSAAARQQLNEQTRSNTA